MYYAHTVCFQRILRCAYKVALFNNVQKAIVSSRTKKTVQTISRKEEWSYETSLLILPHSIERIFTQFRSKCNVFNMLLIIWWKNIWMFLLWSCPCRMKIKFLAKDNRALSPWYIATQNIAIDWPKTFGFIY